MMDPDDAAKVAKTMRLKGIEIALRLFSITKDEHSAPTLAEWLPKHLARKATRITPGTAADYKRMAERTFLRTLGDIPADQITEDDLIGWIAWQLQQPTVAWEKKAAKLAEEDKPAPPVETYTPKSVRNAHGLLSSMLSTLEETGHVKKNLAKGLDLPKDPPKESREIFTRDEWRRFYEAMQDDYKLFSAFLLLTGARIGEATAVRVKDFDFTAQSVRIAQAWKKAEKGVVLGVPKTRRSVRTILLGPEIENFRTLCMGKRPDDLVFTAPQGGQIFAHRFRDRQWRTALERAGLMKDLTPHCLRHTFASWALMAGVAPQVVQMRLGHESLQTTSTVYAHLLLEEQAAAVKAIGWGAPVFEA